MVFEDFGHEAVDTPTYIGQKHKYVSAIVTRSERAFDRVDLSADTLDAGDELLFFFFQVRHILLDYTLGGYGTKW